jgi:hypothetical protein
MCYCALHNPVVNTYTVDMVFTLRMVVLEATGLFVLHRYRPADPVEDGEGGRTREDARRWDDLIP